MSCRFEEATRLIVEKLPEIVQTNSESCYLGSFDGLKISFPPEAVITPVRHEQVGHALKLANEYSVPITARGVGSTLTGGATPVKGGWVLDLHKLNQIQIDPIQKAARVGCGAVVQDIQQAAEKHGLFYPPDPSSYQWCTIGGNIACNAGGLRCVKYGVTRDYVLELNGYLADGTYVQWGRPTRKFASGYNVRDLWIGSEGTLGIVTSAYLRLIRKPKFTETALVGFESDSSAIAALLELNQLQITPSILEFIDELSVKGAQESTGTQFFKASKKPPSVVLVELDGFDADLLKNEMLVVKNWATRHTNLFIHAETPKHAENLWEVRRKCSGAMFALGNAKLNEDVVVPIEKMPQLISTIQGLRDETQVPIAVFGHAGDGNLHVNIMYNREDGSMLANARICLDRLMEAVVSLNGAISGEHGIGLAKSKFMGVQFDEVQLQIMQKIKETFDPQGILNPGKWFDAFSPWEYRPEEHRFPWDKR